MIVAAIDIGTNTTLLLIAEQRAGELVPVLDRATITRLGEGVDRSRQLLPEAVERTLSALRDYAAELRARGVIHVDAVGTSALRDAAGGSEFLDAAEAILGVRPRVVEGELEAELTFRGALSGLPVHGDVNVFDIGGGSTEIIVGSADGSIGSAVSLDIGSVRLFERHVRHDPPTAAELAALRADIEAALVAAPPAHAGAPLVGVAGTVTTLAAIALGLEQYAPERVHGHVLSAEIVDELAERLAALTVEQRRGLAGLEPKRADVIVVGAEIVRNVLRWSRAPSLMVSDRGVRFGVAEALAAAAAASAP